MRYDALTKTIYFAPNSGLLLNDYASVQSAALGLAHEMGHAAQDLDGLMGRLTENVLEALNLETYETPIAKELGEPTRVRDTAVGTVDMQNSTHFRTAVHHSRPWWHYLLFWNLFTPYADITDHNLID